MASEGTFHPIGWNVFFVNPSTVPAVDAVKLFRLEILESSQASHGHISFSGSTMDPFSALF